MIASCVHCIWHELPTYAKTSVYSINNITVLQESPLPFVLRKGEKKKEESDRYRGKDIENSSYMSRCFLYFLSTFLSVAERRRKISLNNCIQL